MSAFRATLVREARRALRAPRGWAIGAAIAVLTGVPIMLTSESVAAVADFGPSISIGAWCVLVAMALSGAAAISGERRHGTWDLLLAAPGRPASVIWAKALGHVALAAVLALGLPLQAATQAFAMGVDVASVVAGFAGLVLVGAVGGAVGLLAGSVARSSMAASTLALLLVAVWTLAARTLQAIGDPWIVGAGFAIDPIRRAQAFADGVIDPGGTLALASAWVCLVWTSARWVDADRRRDRAPAWRRRGCAIVVGPACATIAAIALRGPGVQPPIIDLHDLAVARASEPLARAMRDAEGTIRFTLVRAGTIGESSLGSARQALRRAAACERPAGALASWDEVDLLDPVQAGIAAKAIERIETAERASARAWRDALASGVAALERVRNSASLSDACRQAAARRPQGDLAANNLVALASALQRAGVEGGSWIEAFRAAAAASPERPLGDPEGAARALAAELGVWAKLLRQAADAMAGAGSSRDSREAARRLAGLADECRTAQDQVDRLPPLRLTEVAAALRAPPLVVVTTSSGCAAVPAWRLVEGSAAADEAIASMLAAAQGAPRAAAVFVHAAQRSPLEATSSGADLALVADALRGARMRVEAWNPSQAPRPSVRDARARVWIVVPPLERRSLEPDAAEQALLDATQRLLREGEPVLLLASPSVAAAMGMPDPWAGMLRAQGLEARSGSMVVQLAARSETDRQLRTTLECIGRGSHAAAGLLRGRVSWPAPVPLALGSEGIWRCEPVAVVQGDPSLWIEDDPRVISKGADQVPAGKGLAAGSVVPVLAVSEGEGRRVALAGGVAWALSSSAGVADARGALLHPGNRDLLVATVRWLARDEIASVERAATGRSLVSGVRAALWLPALLMLAVPLVIRLSGRRA